MRKALIILKLISFKVIVAEIRDSTSHEKGVGLNILHDFSWHGRGTVRNSKQIILKIQVEAIDMITDAVSFWHKVLRFCATRCMNN